MQTAKKKILHIIKSLGRGGAEMMLYETLKLHTREKFEFHYIYFLPWKDQLATPLREAGGIVHCFDSNNNLFLIAKAFQLAAYARENNVAIIHAHLPWAGFVSRIVGRLTGIPVIYSEHNKQERYHRVTYWLNRFTFNWQQKVIAVSEDVALSISSNINPNIPVQTVLNGVDTNAFVRNESGGVALRKSLNLPADAVVIGTVAVFRFQKRLDEWMVVLSKVVSKFPNVYGIIVGDGPLKEKLLKKRSGLGINDKLIMAGLQTDVRPWLSAMDIYLMTSVFEGLPLALLEAMSMQCAIVSTNAGGIKELIRDGEDGLLTGTEDWLKLIPMCEELVQNESRRKSLGKKARTRVQQEFSLDKMVAELEDIYESNFLNQGPDKN